jgi:hypothetical protein
VCDYDHVGSPVTQTVAANERYQNDVGVLTAAMFGSSARFPSAQTFTVLQDNDGREYPILISNHSDALTVVPFHGKVTDKPDGTMPNPSYFGDLGIYAHETFKDNLKPDHNFSPRSISYFKELPTPPETNMSEDYSVTTTIQSEQPEPELASFGEALSKDMFGLNPDVVEVKTVMAVKHRDGTSNVTVVDFNRNREVAIKSTSMGVSEEAFNRMSDSFDKMTQALNIKG